MIDVSNTSVYTKTLTGLQESTEYELQVLAYNAAGDGPRSNISLVKTMVGPKRSTKENGKQGLLSWS